jgi:WD40 repeat protein
MSDFTENTVAKSQAFQREILANLPQELVTSGDFWRYYQLLTNFEFIAAKIQHPEFGVLALIGDYNLLDTPEILDHPEYNSEKVKTLKLIQGALRLSAHILAEDNTQLAGQLLGRLKSFEVPEIQAMLEGTSQWKQAHWLRPLTFNLRLPGGPLIYTLTASAWKLLITPNGQRVISYSRKSIKVWNLETGEEQLTFTGYDGWGSIAVTHDSKHLIFTSNDNTLKVWNLETGEELFTLTGHSETVESIVVTPEGKRVISISGWWPIIIKVWDLQSGLEIFTLTCYKIKRSDNPIAVTPDGMRLIARESEKDSEIVTVWNLETGKKLFTLTSHTGRAWMIAITPDGKRIIYQTEDSQIKVFDLETSEERSIIALHGDEALMEYVTVTPDGKCLISLSRHEGFNGIFHVWDLKTGKKRHSFTGYQIYTNHPRFIVVVTSDSKKVIANADIMMLKVWDLETGQELCELTGHTDIINAVAVHPDNKQVVSGARDGTIKVWNLDRQQPVQRGHNGPVETLVLSVDGKRLISRSGDEVKVWNIETTEALLICDKDALYVEYKLRLENASKRHFDHKIIASTPSGKRIIYTSGASPYHGPEDTWDGENHTLKVLDLNSRKELFGFSGDPRTVTAVAMTPDGRRIIYGTEHQFEGPDIRVWDLENGEKPLSLKGHTKNVNAVTITPNGRLMISASYDCTLRVWDLSSLEEIACFTGDSQFSCVVAPYDATIVVGDALGEVHFLRLEGINK